MRIKQDVYGFDELVKSLEKARESAEECAKRAIYDGAAILADKVRNNINSLPTEEARYIRPGDPPYSGVTKAQKQALLDGMGISPIDNVNGKINTSVSFSGYASNIPYAKNPAGLPIPMLAAAVNSGASYQGKGIRNKTQFFTKATRSARSPALKKMEETFNTEIEKSFDKNGG